jgi:hypothetical protein
MPGYRSTIIKENNPEITRTGTKKGCFVRVVSCVFVVPILSIGNPFPGYFLSEASNSIL